MRVFISLPMHGKTMDDIHQEIEKACSAVSRIFPNQEITVIHNADCIAPVDAGRLFFLGSAIQRLDGVDAVYFCPGWEDAKGCQIEHHVCELYGIQRIET